MPPPLRPARLSGLQKSVLSLYRSCLRACRTKPPTKRPHFESFARKAFAEHIHMDKKEFATIEFYLRKGRRQLEIYAEEGVRDVG